MLNQFSDFLSGRITTDAVNSFYTGLPDPDDILKRLGKDNRAYESLLEDAQVISCIEQRLAITASKEIEFKIPDDNRYKDLLAKFNFKPTLNLINQILDATLYGMVVFEIMWYHDLNPNLLYPGELIQRPAHWFYFDDFGNCILKKEHSIFGQEFLINEWSNKFIVIRNKPTAGNPYGKKLLKACYWPVQFKRGGLKFFSFFIEKFGTPTVVGKYPEGSSKEVIDSLLDALENAHADAVVAIPDGQSVEIIENKSSSGSNDAFNSWLKYHDEEIAKAILTQTLTTQTSGTGSYALGSVHSDLLEKVAQSDTLLVEQFLNQLTLSFVAVNVTDYVSSADLPAWEVNDPEDITASIAQMKEQSTVDKTLFEIGVKFTKEYFLKRYKLEDVDFDVSQQATTQPVAFASGDNSTTVTTSNPPQAKINVPDIIINKHTSEVIQPVVEILKSSTSYEDLSAKLDAMYIDSEQPKEVQSFIERVLLVAHGMGVNDELKGV